MGHCTGLLEWAACTSGSFRFVRECRCSHIRDHLQFNRVYKAVRLRPHNTPSHYTPCRACPCSCLCYNASNGSNSSNSSNSICTQNGRQQTAWPCYRSPGGGREARERREREAEGEREREREAPRHKQWVRERGRGSTGGGGQIAFHEGSRLRTRGRGAPSTLNPEP